MGTLSDGEIREHIEAGRLIIGGDPGMADASSYEFRAGSIIRTGGAPEDAMIDWTAEDSGSAVYNVAPGELVWVRTREMVEIPDNLCAFWWQTNRLSRRGLMLVNMTMVEPGYRGPLACLFANFGKQTVSIDRETVVARLVFFDLNRPAEKPFATRKPESQYDRDLVVAATTAPRQFLDLETLSHDVKQQADEAVEHLERLKTVFAEDLGRAATKAREDATAAFAADSRGALLKATPWALAAITLLTVASLIGGWVRDRVTPTDDDVRTQIEDTLDELADNATVTEDLARLRAEVADLRKRLAASTTPTPSPSP